MSHPAEASATELARALASRELSSAELLHALLGRIERLNPALNAIVTLDAERALRRASEADDALARGHSWGPLHGVPFTLKDCFATAGLRTTRRSPTMGRRPTARWRGACWPWRARSTASSMACAARPRHPRFKRKNA